MPVCRIIYYSSIIEKDKHVTLFIPTGSSDGHQSKVAGRWEGCKSFYATEINIYLSSTATRMKDHLIAFSLFSDGFFFLQSNKIYIIVDNIRFMIHTLVLFFHELG